jgi:hypothetical protein
MKKQIVALSFLVVGLHGVAHATFPADAEFSQNLPAGETYADRHAGSENSSWGVSNRAVEPHNPFPFGGGYIDD